MNCHVFQLSNVVSISKYRYSSFALSKISKLALVGYILRGAQSAKTFCVCNISMRSHFMVKLGRDTFECAGNLVVLSTNPFQLCHPHLVVNGKAPKLQGVHFMPNHKKDVAVFCHTGNCFEFYKDPNYLNEHHLIHQVCDRTICILMARFKCFDKAGSHNA